MNDGGKKGENALQDSRANAPFGPDGIGWPVSTHHIPVLSGIKKELASICTPVTEEHLWELAAGYYSAEWKKAKTALHKAERKLQSLLSPDNEPLGLIGMALEGEHVMNAREQHDDALAVFTIINEEILQDKTLQQSFNNLRTSYTLIETSRALSRNMLDLTEQVAQIDATQGTISLSGKFRFYAGRLLGMSPAPRATSAPS